MAIRHRERRQEIPILPERLSYARERLGLTATALADATGLSVAMISRLENGSRRSTRSSKFRVARALAMKAGAKASEVVEFLDGRRDEVSGQPSPVELDADDLVNLVAV